MKKFMILAAAISASAIASPAAAQAVGTVNIQGHVDAKCFVSTEGGTSGTFGATVDLGDLAATTGTLATDLATRFNTTTSGALSAKVICTSATPLIAVEAQPIKADTAVAPTGYADTVNYTAKATLVTVGTNNGPFLADSALAPSAATPVGSRLANAATNITISADEFKTANLNDLLVADTYKGKIIVTISPGA